MGIVFGKTGVAEPAYSVLSSSPLPTSILAYSVRSYGSRFAVETTMTKDNKGFMTLAGYIGVGSKPQNEGAAAISMTAPVGTKGGEAISMTAPVATKGAPIAMTAPVGTSTAASGSRVMSFVLPAEYDSLDKIPKPTNPLVRVVAVPPAVGAVAQFAGWVSPAQAEAKKDALLRQLGEDGVAVAEPADWELWQYNPPFTIPWLRRNEVWVKLTEEQAGALGEKHRGGAAKAAASV